MKWLCASLMCFVLFSNTLGCQNKGRTIGGDSPVTAERLINAKLTDIRQPLSWRFDESTVNIERQGEPIPTDVVEQVIGDEATTKRIQATWALSDSGKYITLTNILADGVSIERDATIPIDPAGAIRVNLGTRQYNVFPKSASKP